MPDPLRRIALVLATVLVFASTAGLVIVYVSDVGSAASDVPGERREYQRLHCMRNEVLADVPLGSVAYVERLTDSSANYWWQRIIDVITPDVWITDAPEKADVVIAVVRGEDEPCDGFGVRIDTP